ncbi:hypothetical protein EYC80_001108 [Monilinia laxa]|uniref:t-SNARE coiled-coil homology domain-containing protein n=1 Tax=Monilinia laxa TaxID=61186 RepID=A0A5N6K924_MONLA|nr:hypothetical protein EYC80_001108 [Monilinia laxa]
MHTIPQYLLISSSYISLIHNKHTPASTFRKSNTTTIRAPVNQRNVTSNLEPRTSNLANKETHPQTSIIQSGSSEAITSLRFTKGRSKWRCKRTWTTQKIGICEKGRRDWERDNRHHGEVTKAGRIGQTQNPLRRPPGGNQRTHLHHQTRPLLPQPTNLGSPKPHASPAPQSRPGGANTTKTSSSCSKASSPTSPPTSKTCSKSAPRTSRPRAPAPKIFVSSVSSHVQPNISQSASPLYSTPARGSPGPGQDLLSLNPVGDQQLLMMEEAQPQNEYIHQRGEAIEAIERTISELGGIFGQLATMVSEQSEMIQRIDANTEDVVDNVEGAQRELLKYWSSVSGNRWLIAKMFGVLMIFFLLWVLIAA